MLEFKEFLKKKKIKNIYHPRLIESLYFDNNSFQMSNDSEEGIVPRKKIRIRKYPNDNDSSIYQETKFSSVEGRFKQREKITLKEFNHKKSFGIFDSQYGQCLPNLFVKYEREYYIYEDVRISIDTNIDYKDFKTNRCFTESQIIVELKTTINKNLDDLIENFPFQRTRFSKYCLGVQKLYHK